MQLYETLPLFKTTQHQLNELAAIREARGEPVTEPALVVASLIHLELIREKKNENDKKEG